MFGHFVLFFFVVCVRCKGENLATLRDVLKPRCQVLVLRLLKNRFQFCLRTASVSGFHFRLSFIHKRLFYFEYGLFKCSTSWRFSFITMIRSSSDVRLRRAIASEVSTWGGTGR